MVEKDSLDYWNVPHTHTRLF